MQAPAPSDPANEGIDWNADEEQFRQDLKQKAQRLPTDPLNLPPLNGTSPPNRNGHTLSSIDWDTEEQQLREDLGRLAAEYGDIYRCAVELDDETNSDKKPNVAPAVVRQILTDFFDETELRNLCFDMGIDYESLPFSGKADKAREVVAYCHRHDRYNDLVKTCQELRPKAFEKLWKK